MPLSAPVAGVMTTPVFSVTPGRLGGEVLFELLERGIRHAPVVNERGQLVGVIEDADLFAVQPRSWFGARRAIARAQSVESLATVARRLPEIVSDLHAANLRALEVARVLSALVDALTVRAIELAGRRSSFPPTDWCGSRSAARRAASSRRRLERGGAVVCSEPPPDGWLEAVSASAGELWPGGRGRCAQRTRSGCEADGDDELSLTVLIERRVLWGTPRDPLPVAEGEEHDRVVGALLRRALDYSPPTGFDADRVLELDGTRSDVLDIRRAAVIPIVELARWAGAAAGVIEGSTPDRLRARGRRGRARRRRRAARWSTRSSSRSSCGSTTTCASCAAGRRPTTAPAAADEPADPRLPARRVPRRDRPCSGGCSG